MGKAKQLLVITVSVIALSACANKGGYVRMHGSTELPLTDIGFVKGTYEYRNGSTANETIRIVQVDGIKVPHQYGVAEGANIVSLQAGEHDIKAFWVHASGEIDLYTYSTFRIDIRPNCTYQFYSKIAVAKKEVYLDVLASPNAKYGNQDCGSGVIHAHEIRA